MDYLVGFILAIGVIVMLLCLVKIAAMEGFLGTSVQLTFGHNYKYDCAADSLVKELLDSLGDDWESRVSLSAYDLRIESPLGCYEIWTINKYYGYCSTMYDGTTYAKVFSDIRISLEQAKRVMALEAKVRGLTK